MTRAAQYLRMSTEHQQYSLLNQSAVIAEYAETKGCVVVKTYSDAAKSGVLMRNRPGLKQLLEDVVTGAAAVDLILVYDVSRWGRFQDTDEAAHYEFICKTAGIPVEYCAEGFSNDSSITSNLMKALKRSMAAEYSRELSVKVRKGQERLALAGYWQGGVPGYGLRRKLIPSDSSRPARILVSGERKGLTDRVVLVPGPREEVEIVNEIFRMFVHDGKSMPAIARILNSRGEPFVGGSKWCKHHVNRVLNGSKYFGCLTYGCNTQRLYTSKVRLPREQWIISPNAFEPIVDRTLFNQAQEKISSFTSRKSNAQIIEDIRKLWHSQGRLSREVIEQARSVACVSTIEKRFGGLLPLYRALGYDCRTKYYNSELLDQLREVRRRLYRKLCKRFPDDLSLVERGGNWGARLRLREPETDLSVAIARNVRLVSGGTRWAFSPNYRERGMIGILVRLETDNQRVYDIHIFDQLPSVRTMLLRPRDERLRAGRKVAGLSDFLQSIKAVLSRTSRGCTH